MMALRRKKTKIVNRIDDGYVRMHVHEIKKK